MKTLGIWNAGRGLWESPTGSIDLFSELSEPFLETWPTSGMTRGGVAYELPTWVPLMDGSAYSLLPPPNTMEMLPVREGEGNGSRRAQTANLRERVVAELLPTPSAMNPNDGEGTETFFARKAKVKAETGANNGVPLAIVVQLLPNTDNSGRIEHGGASQFERNSLPLNALVMTFPGESTNPLSDAGK